MKECDEEKQILFATAIAMQLAEGLSEDEIKRLLILLGQISCSLSNLIGCKQSNKKMD